MEVVIYIIYCDYIVTYIQVKHHLGEKKNVGVGYNLVHW